MPNEVVLKVQQFKTEDKYWEARVLREETIMKKLSTSSLKEHVPKFYLGCTLIIPMENNKRFGVRLTFMEHIDMVPLYRILQESDKKKIPVPRNIYEQIEAVVLKLWKLGISHNDLSVNNILVSGFIKPEIKLIDFGLSTTIATSDFANLKDGDGFNMYKDRYVSHFAGLSKDEQDSNFKKNLFFQN
jgi:serine/threonine protein kinase